MRGQGFTPTGSGQDLIRRLLAYSGMWSWTIERMFNHDALSKDASVKKKCFSSSSDLVLWHTACFGDIARAKQIATALSTLHTPEVSEAQVNSSKYFNSAFSFCNFAHYCFFAIVACCTSAQAYPFVRFVVNEETHIAQAVLYVLRWSKRYRWPSCDSSVDLNSFGSQSVFL